MQCGAENQKYLFYRMFFIVKCDFYRQFSSKVALFYQNRLVKLFLAKEFVLNFQGNSHIDCQVLYLSPIFRTEQKLEPIEAYFCFILQILNFFDVKYL